MNKFIYISLILLLACSDSSMINNVEQNVSENPNDGIQMKANLERTIKVFKATKEIVIDGSDNEWSRAPKHKMRLATNLINDIPITNKDDLSSEFSLLWDADNLYIYAKITDEEQNVSGFEPFERDGFEVYLDGNNSKNVAPQPSPVAFPPLAYDDNDDFFRFISDQPNALSAWGILDGSNFEFAFTLNQNGYEIEIRMPFADLTGFVAEDGHTFGLEFQTNDNDNDERQNFLKWHSGIDNSYFDPSLFGTAVLVD